MPSEGGGRPLSGSEVAGEGRAAGPVGGSSKQATHSANLGGRHSRRLNRLSAELNKGGGGGASSSGGGEHPFAPGGLSARDAMVVLSLYIAAVVHDYDHRGVTNAFLIQDEDPLAVSVGGHSGGVTSPREMSPPQKVGQGREWIELWLRTQK